MLRIVGAGEDGQELAQQRRRKRRRVVVRDERVRDEGKARFKRGHSVRVVQAEQRLLVAGICHGECERASALRCMHWGGRPPMDEPVRPAEGGAGLDGQRAHILVVVRHHQVGVHLVGHRVVTRFLRRRRVRARGRSAVLSARAVRGAVLRVRVRGKHVDARCLGRGVGEREPDRRVLWAAVVLAALMEAQLGVGARAVAVQGPALGARAHVEHKKVVDILKAVKRFERFAKRVDDLPDRRIEQQKLRRQILARD
eukprot:6195317-Pleurochrysis_carterae.AAC.2